MLVLTRMTGVAVEFRVVEQEGSQFPKWILSRAIKQKHSRNGAPGEIRTPDLMLRRHSLYPAELRARFVVGHFYSLQGIR